MNRRDLLGGIPVVLAGAALGRGAKKGRKPVVAAHVWVYAATLERYDVYPIVDRIFSDMKWAGVEAVELMHTALAHADAVERIGEASHRHGLPVIGTSYEAKMFDRSQHAAILEDAAMVIGKLAKLGGRTLGTSVGDPGERKKTPAELDAQAEMVQKITALAERHNVVLNLHNHIYEVRDGEYDLKGTLARFPGAKLGPDLDWLRGAGIDPADFLRRYGRRVVFAHLRDRKADGVWSEALGEGATDFDAIARAFHDIDFQGDVAIELAYPPGFRPTRPLRESLKMSREVVRKKLGW
jgi:sugar phosphate isomerase/epimerase